MFLNGMFAGYVRMDGRGSGGMTIHTFPSQVYIWMERFHTETEITFFDSSNKKIAIYFYLKYIRDFFH